MNTESNKKLSDIDDLLAACRDLIKFHIEDINKFFNEGVQTMNIEVINGVEYLKREGKYYKLTIVDTRDVMKSKSFEDKRLYEAEIRRMICYDFYTRRLSKKILSIKYSKSITRINQIIKKEGLQ